MSAARRRCSLNAHLNFAEINIIYFRHLPPNMAAVGRIGRGSFDFAHKIRRRDLNNKQRSGLLQVSSLFTTCRLGDVENYGLPVVGNAAERMTAGASQDSYAMAALAPLFVYTTEERTERKVTEYEDLLSTKDCRSTGNINHRIIEKNFSWRGVRSQGTFCSPGSVQPRQSQTRAYSGYGPQSEPLFKTKTGYYDILEVASSATQAQIKTAYYKQSFLYHPDRNAGSETATARFSEISEAYTVLGNKALRKKYDRGLLSLSDLVGTTGPSTKDAAGSGAKRRTEGRRSVMGADSGGKIYNFDAFVKAHYQEQLRREKEIQLRRNAFLKHQTEKFDEKKMDWLVEMGIGVMVILAAALWISMKTK